MLMPAMQRSEAVVGYFRWVFGCLASTSDALRLISVLCQLHQRKVLCCERVRTCCFSSLCNIMRCAVRPAHPVPAAPPPCFCAVL